MNKESQRKEPLSAPQVDTLLMRAEKFYEVKDETTMELTIELFHQLRNIAVCGEDERRELWLTAPRGTIEEFADYEEYLEDDVVESREEFEDLWRSEYPEPVKWYRLIAVIYKDIHSVILDGKLILQYQMEPQEQYPYDKSELAGWLLSSVENAITSLQAGTYNESVCNNLPYRRRVGKILREDYWRIFPEEKEAYLSDIEPDEIQRFTERIDEQHSDSPVLRLQEMTAGIFFDCCRLGYEANRYDRIEKRHRKRCIERMRMDGMKD